MLQPTPPRLPRAAATTASRAPSEEDSSPARDPRLPLRLATGLVVILDPHRVIRDAAPSITALLGYTVEELAGRPWEDLLHDDSRRVVRDKLRIVRAGQADINVAFQAHHRDGTWRTFHGQITNLLADPGVAGIAITARDVTDRPQEAEDITNQEVSFRLLFQGNPHPMWVCDLETLAFLEVNDAAVLRYGYSREEFLAMRLTDIRPAAEVPRLLASVASPIAGQHRFMEARHRLKDGRVIDVEVAVTTLRFAGRPATLGVAFDVTSRREAEARLAHQARHDDLTRLPNRRRFVEDLARLCDRRGADAVPFAVLFLDLDGFKLINDSHGHQAGDALLVAAAKRLTAHLRPGDRVARFGGDEFAVLLEGVDEPSEAMQVAMRLMGVLRAPFVLEACGQEVVITTSIGIALGTPDAITPEELLRKADVALYQAKGLGKDRAAIYDGGMDAPVRERLELATDLRRALERGELVLHYQPEVELASGRVVGMEALARWQHPTRGLLPPAMFIPLAEETGLIVPMGRWILEEACRQVAAWRALSPALRPLVMSVNIAACQFEQRDLAEQVRGALCQAGLDGTALRLEITESAVMADMELASANLAACKALGVEVALDDFGTGYSSLSYLLRFPVDVLKIDQSFVQRLGIDPGASAIVQAVTATAQALSLGVIAEGIETPEQLRHVQMLHCRRGQGNYFSPPLAADALIGYLMARG